MSAHYLIMSEKDIQVDEKLNKQKSKKSTEKRTRKSIIIEISIYVAIALIMIFLIPRYVIGRVSVEGQSMENTLHDGDQLIGERISKLTGGLDRFDIIFFEPHEDSNEDDYIKRIIGLPGETVQIIDSEIYINGVLLEEDFHKEPQFSAGRASKPVRLGEDEYFVMGDNRNNSTDSRSKSVGNVKLASIEGRAIFRLWPISDFGTLD